MQELNAVDGESEFLERYCAAFEAFATGTTYISELFRYLVSGETWLTRFVVGNAADCC